MKKGTPEWARDRMSTTSSNTGCQSSLGVVGATATVLGAARMRQAHNNQKEEEEEEEEEEDGEEY